MLELAQQLTYYLSVVDGGASSKLVGWGQQLASVAVIAATAKATFDQMIAPMNAVANAWSGREQQLNNISRSLRQYQYVGESIVDMNARIARSMPGASDGARASEFTRQYQEQFNDARRFSRGLIGEMNRMAAVLPGEMNDYMQSFSQNLPHLSRVRGMTVGRAMNLTSYLTAGGVSAGIDAGQSARDLMQALTTGAHIVDRSWTEVWSQYARFKGKRLDTAGFNRLKLEDKVKVLEDIANQLRPMMDATGDSYDALIGTFRSMRHEMYLTATEPLFNAWKRTLSTVNVSMSTLGPKVAQVARFFSGMLAGRLDSLTERFKGLDSTIYKSMDMFARWLSVGTLIYRRAHSIGSSAYSSVSKVAHRAYGGATDALHALGVGSVIQNVIPFLLSRIAMGVFGPAGYIIKKVARRLFQNGKIWNILAAAGNLFEALLPILSAVGGAMYRIADSAMGFLADVIGDYLPGLLNGLASGIRFVLDMLPIFAGSLSATTAPFRATIGAIWTIVATFLSVEKAIYRFVWGGLAQLFIFTFREMYTTFLPAIQAVGNALNWLMQKIMVLASFIAKWTHSEDPSRPGATQEQPQQLATPSWMYDLQKTMQDMEKQVSDLNRHGRADRQPRPHSVQDFRYSRFDITQKFAEGFDPDRVASAMASDISAMAEQRLESGLVIPFASG